MAVGELTEVGGLNGGRAVVGVSSEDVGESGGVERAILGDALFGAPTHTATQLVLCITMVGHMQKYG